MMLAARTAPKTKGVDILEIRLIDSREELDALADVMDEKAESRGMMFLHRDASNVRRSDAVLLIGSPIKTMGLNCGYCGYPHCDLKPQFAPCAFNSIDVGIAIGSACATAADARVDSRVMFSVGSCALEAGMMPECTQVLAVSLSASSKSPYFDRK